MYWTRSLPALLVLLAACGGEPDAAVVPAAASDFEPPLQAMSLFGEPLYQTEDSTGVIAAADAALAAAPNDVELLIRAARERRNFWQYRQAIGLYTRVIDLAPDDWRAYRFRGHRYLSVREFERGLPDLEAARERAPYNWDVSYHLGLAYFLTARFDEAADEYLRCLRLAQDEGARAVQSDDFRSCSQNGDDLESLTAMTEWAVRALMRAGRITESDSLVAEVPEGLSLVTNIAYYHNLLQHKGVIPADALLNPGPDAPYRLETVGLGVVTQMLSEGDTAGAIPVLEKLVADPWWPGFGRIAAEVELARLRGADVSGA